MVHSSFRTLCTIRQSWTHIAHTAFTPRSHSAAGGAGGGSQSPSAPAGADPGRVGLRRSPRGSLREVLSLILLNSAAIALSCGTYHSFCGNGAGKGAVVAAQRHSDPARTAAPCSPSSSATTARGGGAPHAPPPRKSGSGSSVDQIRSMVCSHLLPPIPTDRYPRFSAWMLHGEVSGAVLETSDARSTAPSCNHSGSDTPGRLPGGKGGSSLPYPGVEGGTLSPVLTFWLTLVVLYLINCAADLAAAAGMRAESVGEARRGATSAALVSSKGSRSAHHRLRGRGDYMQRWESGLGAPVSALDRFRHPSKPPRPPVGGGRVKRTIQKGHAAGVSLINRLGTAIGTVPPGMRPKLLQKV